VRRIRELWPRRRCSRRAKFRRFGDDYEEFKLRIGFRIQAGQVVMQFSDHVERVRMSSGGARKLAAMLTEKAAELDRLGAARGARSKPATGPF